MLYTMFRKRLADYSYLVFLVLFILRNGLTVHIGDAKYPSSQSRSFQAGLDSATGAMHSRMRSDSRKLKRKHLKRRRNRFTPIVTEITEQPHLVKDTNIYLPDAVDNRFGEGQILSLKKNQKMPRIYMTKLPVERIEEEPEIFFTKLLKEKGKSVAVLENVKRRRTMGANYSGVTFEETR